MSQREDILAALLQWLRERDRLETAMERELLRIYEDIRRELRVVVLEMAHSTQRLTAAERIELDRVETIMHSVEREIAKMRRLDAAVRATWHTTAAEHGASFVGRVFTAADRVRFSVGVGQFGVVDHRAVRALMGNPLRLAGNVEQFVLGRIREELVRGVVLGESVPAITRRIAGTGLTQEGLRRPFPSINARARIIARTEVVKAADAGYQSAMEHAAEIIDEEIYHLWSDAKDDRECDVCRDIAEGKHPDYKSVKGYPGVYSDRESPRPVVSTHPGCRCVRVPVLLSWFRDGVLTPEELRRPPGYAPPPPARRRQSRRRAS